MKQAEISSCRREVRVEVGVGGAVGRIRVEVVDLAIDIFISWVGSGGWLVEF